MECCCIWFNKKKVMEDIKIMEDPMCCICFEDMDFNNVIELACHHKVHYYCYYKWFRLKNRHECVYCKQESLIYRIHSKIIPHYRLKKYMISFSEKKMSAFKYLYIFYNNETLIFPINGHLKKKITQIKANPTIYEDIIHGLNDANYYYYLPSLPGFYLLTKYYQKL